MTKEKINEYTLRISQANASQLIVILYDMGLQYIADAKESLLKNNHEELKKNAGYAGKVVSDLIGALRYENELALALRSCYTFIQNQLSLAVIKNGEDELQTAERMMNKLRESFEKIAKEDTSGPVMGNSESVYTGFTYGKKALYDSLTTEIGRGIKI